jgi:hypothetical protein
MFLAVGSASSALTLASSSFTSGTDGWAVENGARGFEWVASGGAPEGYVRAKDFGSDALWFFAAPASFLGDVSAALGGSLSFALKSDSGSKPPLVSSYADVQLVGNQGVRLALTANANPTADWTFFSVPLVAGGAWKLGSLSGTAASTSELAGVLSSLTSLRIRGDFRQGVETTGLDSVTLAAVPESGSGLLLLSGVAVLAGLYRRREIH